MSVCHLKVQIIAVSQDTFLLIWKKNCPITFLMVATTILTDIDLTLCSNVSLGVYYHNQLESSYYLSALLSMRLNVNVFTFVLVLSVWSVLLVNLLPEG